MLTGFEQQTKNLTLEEKIQARSIWRYMNSAFLLGKRITNKEIRRRLLEDTGNDMSGARVRKAINWMHTGGYIKNLTGTSKGYGRAKTRKELLDYAESLEGRINAIKGRLDSVRKDIDSFDIPDRPMEFFNGQS